MTGPMTTDIADLLDFLNLMLECERAGAKALRFFEQQAAPPALARALPALARDEARYCVLLSREITRLGGTPTSRTGDFFAAITALPDWPARLDLLVRGQAWVARRLAERLDRVTDPDLKAALSEMHATHLVNVDEARRLALAIT